MQNTPNKHTAAEQALVHASSQSDGALVNAAGVTQAWSSAVATAAAAAAAACVCPCAAASGWLKARPERPNKQTYLSQF